LRPLTSYELDKAEREGYKFVDSNLAKLIMRIRLGDVALTQELGAMPPQLFTAVDHYYKEVDYWIVFYSMKDFQSKHFNIEDVRKMRYVHDMAMKILGMSSSNDRKIVETIRTPEGKKLAKLIFEFNVPITDEVWKITPLQYSFCDIANNGVSKNYTEDEFEKMIHGSVLPEVLKKFVRK